MKARLAESTAAGRSDRFVWENPADRIARFRDTVIGMRLVELADGTDTEQVDKAFETKVSPMNYKRPTSVITQKLVEQAVQTLTDLGPAGRSAAGTPACRTCRSTTCCSSTTTPGRR